jgi:hypothetical protein
MAAPAVERSWRPSSDSHNRAEPRAGRGTRRSTSVFRAVTILLNNVSIFNTSVSGLDPRASASCRSRSRLPPGLPLPVRADGRILRNQVLVFPGLRTVNVCKLSASCPTGNHERGEPSIRIRVGGGFCTCRGQGDGVESPAGESPSRAVLETGSGGGYPASLGQPEQGHGAAWTL